MIDTKKYRHVLELARQGDDAALQSELRSAIVADAVNIVALVLKKGTTSIDLVATFREALRYDRARIVELLLDHGADLEQRGEGGYTPLLTAATRSHQATLRLLLDRGADRTQRAEDGSSLLHAASDGGVAWLVQRLLDEGCDVHDQNGSGETALHRAALCAERQVVQLLLSRGADPTIRDANNAQPLDYCDEGLGDPEALDEIRALLQSAEANHGRRPG